MALDSGASVSLEFLQRQQSKMLDELGQVRRDLSDVRRLALGLAEKADRTDRHMSDLKEDLNLIFKSELMGAMAHLETRIETRLDQGIEEVRQGLERVLARLENK